MATGWWHSSWGRWGLIGGGMALALVVAGCGDNDDDGVTESTTTETTTTAPPGTTVEVYFSTGDGSDCSVVEPFTRGIDDDVDPVRAAVDELVGGPTTDETSGGAGSFFSSETADMVSSVSLNDGLLVIDFTDLRPVIPNASTSCGSEALLAQLNSTAFQFATIDRARYLIEGSCDDFANWLQRDCFDADRTGNQLEVPTNERASGSGCTPPSDDSLPDGRWFGFIDNPEDDQVSFDLACWFTGSAAAAAAREDGEESPPPNDFHIRNENNKRRTLAVDPSAEVTWLPDPGDPESSAVVTYEAWEAEQSGRAVTPGIWLTVEGGGVISVEEQYVP